MRAYEKPGYLMKLDYSAMVRCKARLLLSDRFYFFILIYFLCNQFFYSFGQEALPKASSSQIAESQKEYLNTSLYLKVLLVEFSDIKHNTNPSYTLQNWEDLFFSKNTYFSPNKFSPDGQKVFGSVNDYYGKMSNNNLTITGRIVNKDSDHDGIPDWIKLENTKNSYNTITKPDFITEALNAAKKEYLDVDISDSNTVVVIIYAGMVTREFPYYLNPHVGFEKNLYIMGEKFAPFAPYNDNRSDAKFTHIGQHVHELAHCIGLWDLYNYDSKNSGNNGVWDLMAAGTYNGPTFGGEIPAPINPIMRKFKGWFQYNTISDSAIIPVKTLYNLESPIVYQIKCLPNNGNYFLIEGRIFDAVMSMGSSTCPDYNTGIPELSKYGIRKGILVWRVTNSSPGGQILHSSGLNWNDGNYAPYDIFPGLYNVNVLNPWSSKLNITAYNWAPNTYPSTNAGMNIAAESDEYFDIVLYSRNPELAPPSRPQNLQIGSMLPGNSLYLSWDFSNEPTMKYRKGKYEVSRKDKLTDGQWKVLGVLNENIYLDNYYLYNNSKFEYDLSYRVRAIDASGNWSTYSDEVSKKFLLKDTTHYPGPDSLKRSEIETFVHYPNPLNNSANVSIKLISESRIKLTLYDILGREIKTFIDERHEPGEYSLKIDFAAYSSGVYFLKAEADKSYKFRKITVIK